MKKTLLIVLFSVVMSGAAYAGIQAGQTQMALSLPQPCTIFLCTAGIAVMHCLTKRRNT